MTRRRKRHGTILLVRNLTRNTEQPLFQNGTSSRETRRITCARKCECDAMSPNPGTLYVAAVILGSAVCSGLAGRDSAVSDSTERSESEIDANAEGTCDYKE